MTDERINVRQIIAAILAQHGELEDSGGMCECGWPEGNPYIDHVASLIAEAVDSRVTEALGIIRKAYLHADIEVVADAIYNEIHGNRNYSAMDLARVAFDATGWTR